MAIFLKKNCTSQDSDTRLELALRSMTSAYAETFAVRPSQNAAGAMKTSRSVSIYTVDDIASRQSTFMSIDNLSKPLLSTSGKSGTALLSKSGKSAKARSSINQIVFE